MGQKVNPNGFRLGVIKEHNTKWFAFKKEYVKTLIEDQKIYDFFKKLVRQYQIGDVTISRFKNNKYVNIKLHSAKPGELIGKESINLIKLTNDLKRHIRNRELKFTLEVIEIQKPELNARLVAENIAIKLENRAPFRIAQKQAIRAALKSGAIGIKTSVSGRLNGVDMARKEGYSHGEMRLHTLRQDVDYAHALAHTKYGVIGVKIWISKGEILNNKDKQGDQ
ncbi:MAG: 30S ribosomal protein S3 [Mycoplasma sp.]|nr:30S ribosomal protein S3 [Mycoplasma sp.]